VANSHLPFLQFYPADWIQDTQILSLAAQGAWIKFLCAMHTAPTYGSIRWSVDKTKRFLGISDQSEFETLMDQIWEVADMELQDEMGETVDAFGQASYVCITSRRMVRDNIKRNNKLTSQRRWRDKQETQQRSNGEMNETGRSQKSEIRSHISGSGEEKTVKQIRSKNGPKPETQNGPEPISDLLERSLQQLHKKD
jgi:hypothetical protein